MAAAEPTLRLDDLRGRGGIQQASLGLTNSLTLTYNGRGAIYQLLQALDRRGRDTVLVPAFHCPTVVDPALAAGWRVRFYRIDQQLSIDANDFAGRIDRRVAAVLVINYLGFPSNLEAIADVCRRSGIVVIEDCSHSFLMANPLRLAGERGDAATYSFWKTVPSLVGGGIRINVDFLRSTFPPGSIPIPDSVRRIKWLLEQVIDNSSSSPLRLGVQRLESMRRRMKRANSRPIDEVVRKLQFEYPFDPVLATAGMPWSARMILNRVDLDAVCSQRRDHYQNYASLLDDTSTMRRLNPRLPDRICPWAFPVLLESRSEIDYKLRENGVPLFTFGETLHPAVQKRGAVDEHTRSVTDYLSNCLLCLAVHQNLDSDTVRDACLTIRRITRHSR
ncbi:MAG: DegT/DnrJ/EryC1/StrS family aminotransferase [Gammaproteobacteria bacterium]